MIHPVKSERVSVSRSAANTKALTDTLVLTLVALVLYLWQLGAVPLRDWDEGTIAQVARGLFRSGDWIYPILDGAPYLNKPPLVEWLMATTYSVAGVSEWTSRLLPAAVSALAVPLLYGIGRIAFGQRRSALLSAGILLTLLPVVRHGRLAMRDGVAVTLFLALLLCLLKSLQNRRYALGIGPALGLIVLTKGILALLLGAVAVAFGILHSLLAERKERTISQLSNPYLWVGLVLGLLPAALWYGAQIARYGETYWQGHFLGQSFSRVVTVVESHQGPPWYYLIELLELSWPWLLFWLPGLWLAWRQRRRVWAQLTLAGTVVYLGAISIMSTKLPWYIMPLYPFVALAVGGYLGHRWQVGAKPPRWAAGFLGLIAIAGLGGGLYIGIAEGRPSLLLMGLLLGGSAGWATGQLWRGQWRWCWTLMAGLYATLLVLMGSNVWLWELNEAFDVKPVAALVRSHVPDGVRVVTTFGYGRPSLDFYSDRTIPPVSDGTLVEQWETTAYALVLPEQLEVLPPHQILGEAAGLLLIQTLPKG